MTDLERAREILEGYPLQTAQHVIAEALAAARREGAEAAVVKLKAEAVAEARDAALEEAARVCERADKSTHPAECADMIRALNGNV